MLKFKHPMLIVIAGLVWLSVGIFLLTVGLRLISTSAQLMKTGATVSAPLLGTMTPMFDESENAGVLLIAVALFIGYFKGRFALAKSARRTVDRIRSLPSPLSLHRIYSPKFLLLIGSMIALGILIKVLNIPGDIRGGIDVVIGSALISGSLIYFRLALQKG